MYFSTLPKLLIPFYRLMVNVKDERVFV
jgi:hypothetical protein